MVEIHRYAWRCSPGTPGSPFPRACTTVKQHGPLRVVAPQDKAMPGCGTQLQASPAPVTFFRSNAAPPAPSAACSKTSFVFPLRQHPQNTRYKTIADMNLRKDRIDMLCVCGCVCASALELQRWLCVVTVMSHDSGQVFHLRFVGARTIERRDDSCTKRVRVETHANL
jgi:hypothetical protein